MTARWQPSANCRWEARGVATGSSRGTNITSSASDGVNGSWTDIGAATTFDYHSVFVQVFSTLTGDMILDLGLSDGSNRAFLATDLRVPALKGARTGAWAQMLPLYVPAGAQLSARLASTPGGKSASILVVGGSGGFGGMPGFFRMVPMYTIATSRGTDIDPTVANTKTSWVEITPGITSPIEGLMVGIGPGNEITRTAGQHYLIDIGVGSSGSESVLLPNLNVTLHPDLDQPTPCMLGPFPVQLPASTRVAARAQTSDVTVGERKIDVALWGLVR